MSIFLLLPFYVFGSLLVHELGHLFSARICRVPAFELRLGIGPRLLRFTVRGFRFCLRPFPIASVVLLDGKALHDRPLPQQLLVHMGGILFNLVMGCGFYGTTFGWINLLLAGGNLLPLYHHDGWRCGILLVRGVLQRKSEPVERAFTYSGAFVSLVITWQVIKVFV